MQPLIQDATKVLKSPAEWDNLQTNLDVVLTGLAKSPATVAAVHAVGSSELAAATAAVAAAGGGSGSSDGSSALYLSSYKLFGLQLADSAFRRGFLVQVGGGWELGVSACVRAWVRACPVVRPSQCISQLVCVPAHNNAGTIHTPACFAVLCSRPAAQVLILLRTLLLPGKQPTDTLKDKARMQVGLRAWVQGVGRLGACDTHV
jgi:hypothetical protein